MKDTLQHLVCAAWPHAKQVYDLLAGLVCHTYDDVHGSTSSAVAIKGQAHLFEHRAGALVFVVMARQRHIHLRSKRDKSAALRLLRIFWGNTQACDLPGT